MYRIGVISDTHNVLREEVINDLKKCDYILHAGDIMKEEILIQLRELAPVIAVKGNNDQLSLNEEESFEIGGFHFYMIHQIGGRKDVDFYIFGHSHQYTCYKEEGVQYINPGSCGRRRFSLPLTYVIIEIEKHHYVIHKKEL
ncbi:metallophosphoesterase family protein [Candidatus Stoquefichus massiliensis]|uniref:metallophosphoesterase family protein n=1 Tax=Candidatus Stoquefichus massiliensis TaxID=1470350 RepID=UPI000483B346|nr:metallophosphoesterase family protein [Candidatus Stoquefichus massiliensis]